MDSSMLPKMDFTTILVGYLVIQLIVAISIYWILSVASRREIHRVFGDAGHEFFLNGFDEAARASLAAMIKESHERAVVTADLAISTAKELALKTSREADMVAERLNQIDRQLGNLNDTFNKIDQMRTDMHETNVSVAELHTRLTDFFERRDGNE
jgi:hypothetical protein